MHRFNLSEWAINHKVLVVFFMLLIGVAGFMSYEKLGRQEDPDFTVQTMVVQTMWPGATTLDTMQQVTDRIEKKLQQTPGLDYLKSFTKPGVSVIYVNLKDSTDPATIPDIWYEVRKKVADIQRTLPQGVQGPFFNDEFGDVYGVIYGITFDGFSYREARDYAETARSAFLEAPDVSKADLVGAQDERIYLTFSTQKLAALGITLDQVLDAVTQQNAIAPAGIITTQSENVLVEVSGALVTEAGLRKINLYINNRFYRLADIAAIERGYVDPPQKLFRINGKPAIGIALSMRSGGNNLAFGEHLAQVAAKLEQRFPIGIDVKLVSDQPKVVSQAIGGFTKALFEAIAIVLGVSFLSLGLRAGVVVALSIPLVLAMVFVAMDMMNISLQRISLGALIIALGLLVDDAMITVEMMIAKMEEGFEKAKAATFAYVSTAFPMLTGTLITVFGFLPIGFAKSNVGQYCFSLFAVIAIALIASWFVAVLSSPVIGVAMLSDKIKGKHGHGPGRFERVFRGFLVQCMRWRFVTIAATIGLFVGAVALQGKIQREFFPASDRPEVLLTLTLPKNASIHATEAKAAEIQKLIDEDPGVERSSSYVGGGAVRFYLPLDVQLDNDFVAQFIIVAKGLAERDALIAKLNAAYERDIGDALVRVSKLELGPPVGWPVQYRVAAETTDDARTYAEQLAVILRDSPDARLVNFDWSEKDKAIRLEIDQDAARQVGLSSQAISQALNTVLNGKTATQVRDSIYLIPVVARAGQDERLSLDTLRNLQIGLPNGRSVPLVQVAKLDYTLQDAYVWRRDLLPTITVQADTGPGIAAPTLYAKLRPKVEALRAKLPPGASITEGGAVEKSAQSNASIAAQVPLMILGMLIVLMIQLQSFQRVFLVISVAPLGLIGVVAAMLPTHTPMGFVANLGIIALAGMIIRNSVILIDQIEHNRALGQDPWEAVVSATEHRLRPIILTAAAAILGMIPIMHDVFWGPMAYAIIGGLAGATLLTLLFLPALYVAWFRIPKPAGT